MKLTWIALPGVLLLGACSSSQHDVPKPPHIGMPNPAAVYCEQQGGYAGTGADSTRRAF
ncbi:hemolysin [Salmonella bongori]|nr:hemolysin [Salmonella bongori]